MLLVAIMGLPELVQSVWVRLFMISMQLRRAASPLRRQVRTKELVLVWVEWK